MVLTGGRLDLFLCFIALFLCMTSAGQVELANKSATINCEGAFRKSSKCGNTSSKGNETNSGSGLILSESGRKILRIFLMSESVIGVFLNAAVILAIAVDPVKLLRKGPWITILNLAIADFIACASCFFFWGSIIFDFVSESDAALSSLDFLWGLSVSSSFFMLTFLAVQIYCLTLYPIKSRYVFTAAKTMFIIIVIWMLACSMGLVELAYLRFTWRQSFKFYIAKIGILEFALLILIVLNVRVCREIVRSGHVARNGCSQYSKHRNMAKTVVMLSVVLLFTAFPYFVLKQIEFCAVLGYVGDDDSWRQWAAGSYCYEPVAILNFSANPILYSLRLPDYRTTFLALIGKKTVTRNKEYMRSQKTSSFLVSERSKSSPVHEMRTPCELGIDQKL